MSAMDVPNHLRRFANTFISLLLQKFDDVTVENHCTAQPPRIRIIHKNFLILVTYEAVPRQSDKFKYTATIYDVNKPDREQRLQNEQQGGLYEIGRHVMLLAETYFPGKKSIQARKMSQFYQMMLQEPSDIGELLASEMIMQNMTDTFVILSYKTWAYTCQVEFEADHFIAHWQDGSIDETEKYVNIKTVQAPSARELLNAILKDSFTYGLLLFASNKR
jgi:hypothetical protein